MLELISSLEDRVVSLIEEVEKLRVENKQLRQDHDSLRGKTETEQEKIQGILSLLEGVDEPQQAYVSQILS